MSFLELRDVNAYYGKSHVLFDLSLRVDCGELVALLGRNGAGKSTTLRSIMGVVTVKSGMITFRGDDITNDPSHTISDRGIAYIPEGRRIFTGLTVEENLRTGYAGHDIDASFAERAGAMYEYFPRLEERTKQRAGTMSGGEQQMLAIARALISEPDLVLIDEPTEGLMPSLITKLKEVLPRINESGISMLLIEQNAKLAMDISDRTYVIGEGRLETEGPSDELRTDEAIQERYLTV